MQWRCSEQACVSVATVFDSRVCTAPVASRVVERLYGVTGIGFLHS
jgi:hypothetical protein